MSGSVGNPFDIPDESPLGNMQGNNPYAQIPQLDPRFSGPSQQSSQGLFGVSPSTWQNIAAMGAGAIQGANARTADGHLANGTGIAGGIMGATQGYLGNVAQQNEQRINAAKLQGSFANQASEAQLRRAQIQSAGIDNTIKMAGLPAVLARSQMQAQAFSDPTFVTGSDGTAPFGGDYSSFVAQKEGTGANPQSTAKGYGQFTDPTWADYVKSHPQTFQGMSSQQVSDFRTNPAAKPVMDDAVNWLAQQNAPQLAQAGVPVTGQTSAMAHMLGAGPAAAAYKAAQQTPNVPMAQVISGALPGPAAAAYLQANPNLQKMTAGQFAQGYAGAPNPAGQQQQGQPQQGAPGALPGGMSSQEAFARAEAASRQAVRLQMAGWDATPATQKAAALQKYALDSMLQQSKPQSLRGEGSALITPQGVTQTPVVRKILGPDNREYQVTMNTLESGDTPRPADVPAWAPKGALSIVPSDLAPGEHEAQKASAGDAFGEKARAQYASAQGSLRALEDVKNQFETLNQTPGWYNTGQGAEWKNEVAKVANSVTQSYGGQPMFDPDKIAAGEDLMKQSKLLGMQTLSSMFGGSREAASIIHSTQGAVPNIENTPAGGKLVLNGLTEAANWQSDQHTFMANWYRAHKGDMVGADVAFSNQYNPQAYARRGISEVKPIEVDGDSPPDPKRFLPGTRLVKKGGDPTKVKIMPGPTSITPTVTE